MEPAYIREMSLDMTDYSPPKLPLRRASTDPAKLKVDMGRAMGDGAMENQFGFSPVMSPEDLGRLVPWPQELLPLMMLGQPYAGTCDWAWAAEPQKPCFGDDGVLAAPPGLDGYAAPWPLLGGYPGGGVPAAGPCPGAPAVEKALGGAQRARSVESNGSSVETCDPGELVGRGVPGLGHLVLASQERMPTIPPRPQTLSQAFFGETGIFRVSWTVDAKKLKSSDKVAVSPSFELPDVPGSFKMMLYPTAVSDRRGGASFKKAKGKGSVQLKCEAALAEASYRKLSIRISVGSMHVDHFAPHLSDGPVEHDFAESGALCLPRHLEGWNFSSVVNETSQTFAVSLEVMPCLR